MNWSRELTNPSPHSTAVAVHFVVFLIVPVLVIALLGITELVVWSVSGVPHAWGFFNCLSFFLLPALPWLIALSMLGALILVISAVLVVLRRWMKFSLWVPPVLALPVLFTAIGKPNWSSFLLILFLTIVFTVYWTALCWHSVIMAWPTRTRIKAGLSGVLGLFLVATGLLLGSFWKAKSVVDADLASTGDSRYKCKRAGFILGFDGGVFVEPYWVFRYEDPSTGDGLRRIYVSVPDCQMWQTRIGLDASPMFGVLP